MLSRPISGSGGVYRVINVKDYGATGDGVTDDSSAISTAIAALGTYRRLFFPAGTYIVNSQLTVALANATVFGEGRFASVIKLKNSSAITAGQTILLLSAAGITVEDIGIEGNSTNNSTVAYDGIGWTTGLNDITIRRAAVNAVTSSGILAYTTTTPNLRNDISENYITNSGNVGIALYYGKDCKINRNTSVSSGGPGIYLTHGTTAGTHNSEKNLVQGNTVNRGTPPTVLHPALGGVEYGFLIALDTGVDNTTVDGNHCWDNRNAVQDGIGLGQDGANDPKGTVITNNIVGYAGLFGIDATNQSVVSNNYVYRPKQYGITAVIDLGGTLQDVTISDNIVIDPMYGGNVGYSAGIISYSNIAGGQIKNLKITDNTVRDSIGNCANGVHLVSGNATFTDVEVAHNNLKNIVTASVTLTGTAFTNLMVKDNIEKTPFRTFINADTTPSVLAGEMFKCSNTGATTVTAFDSGYTGQEIEVVFTTANTTINETGNIKLQGADAVNPAADDVYRFRFDGTSWFQVGGGAGGNDVDGGLIGESDTSGQTVDGGSL